MDANPRQTGSGPYTRPNFVDSLCGGAFVRSDKNIWVALYARQLRQYRQGGRIQINDFGSSLAVRQTKAFVLKIDVYPSANSKFRFSGSLSREAL